MLGSAPHRLFAWFDAVHAGKTHGPGGLQKEAVGAADLQQGVPLPQPGQEILHLCTVVKEHVLHLRFLNERTVLVELVDLFERHNRIGVDQAAALAFDDAKMLPGGQFAGGEV